MLLEIFTSRGAGTLIAAHPAADPRGIGDLVHFVAVVSEGSSVIYGTRSSRATPHRSMVDLVMRMVRAITDDLEAGGQSKDADR